MKRGSWAKNFAKQIITRSFVDSILNKSIYKIHNLTSQFQFHKFIYTILHYIRRKIASGIRIPNLLTNYSTKFHEYYSRTHLKLSAIVCL